MKSNVGVLAALLVLSLTCTVVTTPAVAAVVSLGGGWQASWDASFDPDGLVGVEFVALEGDVLIVRKIAKFTQPPVNGVFPTIPIKFTQIDPDAAKHIVIDDESVENSTGVDWTDFHIDLLVLSGNTVFNPASTSGSGGPLPIGWDIAPFKKAVFTSPVRLDIWDGVVPAGQFWLPGSAPAGGPGGGQLWLDVFPDPQGFASFWLKETPTPEPATLCMLALGGVALLTRGRRVAG